MSAGAVFHKVVILPHKGASNIRQSPYPWANQDLTHPSLGSPTLQTLPHQEAKPSHMKLQLSGVQDNSLSTAWWFEKIWNARKRIKEARTACNYLWCLVPEKGILKGKGKKESFYHVFQKLCEAISLYWISLPIVPLLLLSPQLLETSIWKEFFFIFFILVQALCHSETLHLFPRKQVWDRETRRQGALLFVNGWRATRIVTEPEITVSVLKQVNRGADCWFSICVNPFC